MKIYDSVHGFIHFNELESALIDTEVFQRLRYIHQLGISYMVYPGGTHTRFEHSLGTMHLASLIYDRVAHEEDRGYWKQMVRLAGLCHDFGHLPFSHVAEHALLGAAGHEEWTLRIIESPYLREVFEQAKVLYPEKPVIEHVCKLAIGEEKLRLIRPEISFSDQESLYSQIVTGDFVGADRIDYLLRDARATGLSYGLFDYMQLIEMLVPLPREIGVEENGIASCEALLLARHFMQRRVYQYPTARAYSFHMARFMKILYGDPRNFESVDTYLEMTEYEVLSAIKLAKKDPKHPGHLDALALHDRKKRFRAIHLPQYENDASLQKYKEKWNLPDGDIQWEFAVKNSLKTGLGLPVLRKNSEITKAEAISEIQIPPTKKNWLYLAPECSYPL